MEPSANWRFPNRSWRIFWRRTSRKPIDLYLVPTGANDFPHSRQDVLDRGVINPQNGHILADGKLRTGGASEANILETDPVMRASRLRKSSRNWRRTGSIRYPLRSFSHPHGSVMRRRAEAFLRTVLLSASRHANDDTPAVRCSEQDCSHCPQTVALPLASSSETSTPTNVAPALHTISETSK